MRISDWSSAWLFRSDPAPVLNALFAPHEPKTGTDGTLAWVADVRNPSTDDDFVLMLKELQMPDGSRRPYSMWLTGAHPRALDGLCKLLSREDRKSVGQGKSVSVREGLGGRRIITKKRY